MQKLTELLQSNQPIIVGALNITPDSFSDGGKFLNYDKAIEQALNLFEAGAAIIDIGGEATGPGSKPIAAEEEIDRIIEVVRVLAGKIPISVDTYHAATAKAALEAGAQIINDTSAMRGDNETAHVVADHGAMVALMYCKDSPLPHVTKTDRNYSDVVKEIGEFFEERISYAISCGVNPAQIILDPGMGGFVSLEHEVSWELLARLEELTAQFAQFPFLVGTSRKGFLGGTLKDRDPVSQLTSLAAVKKGAKLIRTHNPGMLKEFLAAESLCRGT